MSLDATNLQVLANYCAAAAEVRGAGGKVTA